MCIYIYICIMHVGNGRCNKKLLLLYYVDCCVGYNVSISIGSIRKIASSISIDMMLSIDCI